MQENKENKMGSPNKNTSETVFAPSDDGRSSSMVEDLTSSQQFRKFFTTSVIEVPDEMKTGAGETAEKKRKGGWLRNLFKTHDDIEDTEDEENLSEEDEENASGQAEDTGEIRLTEEPDERALAAEKPAAHFSVVKAQEDSPAINLNVVPFPVIRPQEANADETKAVTTEKTAAETPEDRTAETERASMLLREEPAAAEPAAEEPASVVAVLQPSSEELGDYSAKETSRASKPVVNTVGRMPTGKICFIDDEEPEEDTEPKEEAEKASSAEALTKETADKITPANEPTVEISLINKESIEETVSEEEPADKIASANKEPSVETVPAGEQAAVNIPTEEPTVEISLTKEEPIVEKASDNEPAPVNVLVPADEPAAINIPADESVPTKKEPTGEVILDDAEPTGEVILGEEELTGEVPVSAQAAEDGDGFLPLDGRKHGWKAFVGLFAADGEETEEEELPKPEPAVEKEMPQKGAEDLPAEPEKHNLQYSSPEDADGIRDVLQKRTAMLTLRAALTGILAAALIVLDLMGQSVIPSPAIIDPVAAPAAWLGVHLILLGICVVLALPVMKNGLTALLPHNEVTADALPALAAVAALLQAAVCLLQANAFDPAEVTVFSGLAALLLFANSLGRRITMNATAKGFDVMTSGVNNEVGYCPRDKRLLDTLCKGMDEEEPSLLLSRSGSLLKDFVPQSLAPHHSDRIAVEFARTLGVTGILCFLIMLLKGCPLMDSVSAMAAVLCMGAPLSAMLVRAVPAILMERAAAQVGAAVPGWPAIEQMGEVDVIHADASELFPPMCAHLYGIKTFRKERIDLAILYATSILIESCNTLSGMFLNMIENNTSMLYAVKDLEKRAGLGFVAWCDNCRIVLGSRELMMQEGISLPAMDYENRYSQDGERHVLYLAVSGDLYAMFLFGYSGTKRIAHILGTLRHENIRLLVTADDPTLTSARIEEAYRLRPGFVKVLNEQENNAMMSDSAFKPTTDGCLVHLNGIASLIGGLQAAAGAQAAERNACTVQTVSIVVSVLLSLLLSFAGSISHIALGAVLLYQAAWSALAVTLTLTKKY